MSESKLMPLTDLATPLHAFLATSGKVCLPINCVAPLNDSTVHAAGAPSRTAGLPGDGGRAQLRQLDQARCRADSLGGLVTVSPANTQKRRSVTLRARCRVTGAKSAKGAGCAGSSFVSATTVGLQIVATVVQREHGNRRWSGAEAGSGSVKIAGRRHACARRAST